MSENNNNILHVILPQDLKDRLVDRAAKEHRSITKTVIYIIERYLDDE